MTVIFVVLMLLGTWFVGLIIGWALESSDEERRRRRIRDARLLRSSIEGPRDLP